MGLRYRYIDEALYGADISVGSNHDLSMVTKGETRPKHVFTTLVKLTQTLNQVYNGAPNYAMTAIAR